MRSENGKFLEGNKGGTGIAKASTRRRRLAQLNAAVTDAEWLKVCKTALELAKAGDRHAREWLSKYLLPETVPDDEDEINEPVDQTSVRRAMRDEPGYLDWLRVQDESPN